MQPAKHLFYSMLYKTDSKRCFKALMHNRRILRLGKPYLINNVNITFKISEISNIKYQLDFYSAAL